MRETSTPLVSRKEAFQILGANFAMVGLFNLANAVEAFDNIFLGDSLNHRTEIITSLGFRGLALIPAAFVAYKAIDIFSRRSSLRRESHSRSTTRRTQRRG